MKIPSASSAAKESCHLRNAISCILLCSFLFLTFAGCGQNQPEAEIRAFYEEFIQVDLADPLRAIEEYVYYNDEVTKAVAIDSIKGNYTTHYDILSLEKITDQLWAIELYIETSMDPEGFTAYNFVGKIDGAYKIIRGIDQIPKSLSQNLNFDAYLPTGDYLNFDDVMIETEGNE